eukprot:Sspe_Gene.104820::Locus_81870_Transcript_1_1_Confidence_1.000_Length_468::g.104820::m.104820
MPSPLFFPSISCPTTFANHHPTPLKDTERCTHGVDVSGMFFVLCLSLRLWYPHRAQSLTTALPTHEHPPPFFSFCSSPSLGWTLVSCIIAPPQCREVVDQPPH